jgi:16S rRNA (guanine(527)-N(7))-methyltransferase RsmG
VRNQVIGKSGLLASRAARVGKAAQPAVAFDVVDQPAGFLRRPAGHDGEIGFADVALAELGAETRGTLGGARQGQKAGHGCIQPVDNAQKYPARLVEADLEPPLGEIGEIEFAGVVALHSQPCWFIKHQQMVIRVKHRPARMKDGIYRDVGGIDHAGHVPFPDCYYPMKSRRTSPAQPGPENLAAIFAQCGILLSERQIEQFWIYHGLLRRHNQDLNLTRIHNFSNMVLKLYVDAVLPAQLMTLPSPLMDLGTGPGMPGLPLKIVRPEIEIWLAETRTKRVDFLRAAVEQLGLKDVVIIDRKITPAFDRPVAGIITRAVATIDQTLSDVGNCLRQNGTIIFMKGPGCEPEVETASNRFAGRYELRRNQVYRIGNTPHERRLVVFERLDVPPATLVAEAARRHAVHDVTSEANPHFKALKKLLTGRGIKKAGQALMSGKRPVEEMLMRHPERCRAWITAGDSPPPPASQAKMPWLQLAPSLFHVLDLFGTHGALLCIEVPEIAPWSPAEGFAPGCSVLLPFQDPENLGAAIRSAAAFGVSEVILLTESAHPYHPKALRASGGVVPAVRLRQGPSLAALAGDLPILSLSADGIDISAAIFPPAFGLLAGLEGPGLPESWRRTAVRIPIDPAVESLNAAAAVAVALYEWRRRFS